jgi:DNA processing protein
MAHQPADIPEATLRLLLVPGVGPATMRAFAAAFGSHERAVAATIDELARLPGFGRAHAESIRRGLDAVPVQAEREAMVARGCSLILHGDDDYPPLLSAIPDPPAALWVRGTLEKRDRLAVAIVGSRQCTPYGREQAGRFAALLAECGLVIVSGGALGVDGEAHRGALRAGGRTIVVLACGLSTAYPPEHAELFDRVAAEGGAVVSEHPMDTAPKAQHFPARNRIISGLSLGVLVIEAAKRSGALITARLAAEEHGREVMALPGRVDSPASAGCLAAVREGWAALVLSHADVLAQLDASSQLVRGALEAAGHEDASRSATLFDGNLTESQQAIVETLTQSQEPLLVDQLAARTQLPLSRLMADLTLLQIRGRVSQDRGLVRLKG